MIEVTAEEVLSEFKQRVAAFLAQSLEESAIQTVAIRKQQERITELENPKEKTPKTNA